MIETSKRENFYQQEYCGCVYSLRDAHVHRIASGRERIKLGVFFCADEANLIAADTEIALIKVRWRT